MRAVIINPASASGRTAARWRRIVAALERRGEQLEVLLTTRPGEAISLTRRLIDDGICSLIVLGGDGTVGEVIAGCLREDGRAVRAPNIDISVIHQGTGGDFTHSLGIPKDEAGAIAVALGDHRRRIDAGVARYHADATLTADSDIDPMNPGVRVRGFASCANVGMSAEVVELVGGALKRFGNAGAFAVATVRCIARNRARFVRVQTSTGFDRELNVVDVAVCTSKYMGGGMFVAPDAVPDDGKFDAVIIAGARRLRLLRTFPKIYKGTHVRDPLVRVEQAADVTITPVGETMDGVVLDGELVGRTPVTFSVIAGALDVRVPAAAVPAR